MRLWPWKSKAEIVADSRLDATQEATRRAALELSEALIQARVQGLFDQLIARKGKPDYDPL